MSLRVSLTIDGDAKGAVAASAAAKAAVTDFSRSAAQVQGQAAAASGGLGDKMKVAAANANEAGGHFAGMSTQAMALSHAVRGAAEQIALGVPPTQALFGQINHLTYAASGPGGLSAALSQVGKMARGGLGWLAATVGVAGGVAAGVAAIGVAAVVAATQYGAAQHDIENALLGIGRASGVTQSQVNAIATQSSSAFGLSTAEARNFATTLAATGKIGQDQIAKLTPLGDQVARIFGEDPGAAAQRLAEAFANPAKGAADLNQRLGFLDASTLKLISDMQAQGNVVGAQGLLFTGLKQGLDGVNTSISTSSRLWTAIGNSISNVWGAFSRGASRLTGIGFTQGLDEKLEQSKQRVADLQKQIDGFGNTAGNMRPTQSLESLGKELDAEKQKLQQLQGEWARYWDNVAAAATRRDSFSALAAVDQALPDEARLSSLQNNFMRLALEMEGINRTGGEASPKLDAMGMSWEKFAHAVEEAKGKVEGFQTSSERAIAGLDAQIAAVGQRSPAARGHLAYQQTLSSLGSNSPSALAQAERARTLATLQGQQQLIDAQNQRVLSAKQGVESAQLELNLVGRSSAEQDRQRSILQAKNDLEQEALQIYGNSADYDQRKLAALTAQIDKQSQIKALLGEQNALNDARFEREQLSRTSEEQAIASRLRQVYGDKYKDQLGGQFAQTLRGTNEQAFNKDLFVGGLKDFNSQLQQTHNLSQAALGAADNLLAKLQGRLLDMVANNLWNEAFGGKSGGGFSILSLFGGGKTATTPTFNANEIATASAFTFATGGYTGDYGIKQATGIVHGREYVFDAESTRRIGPANLESFRRGVLRGYASGGYVGPPSFAGGAMMPAGGPSIEINITPPPGVVSTQRKSKRPDGGERVDIVQSMKDTSVSALGDGSADATLAARMALKPQVRRVAG